MKPSPKLTLSAEELRLVSDAGWILTKHAVIDKLYEMFGQLSEQYKFIIGASGLPEDVIRYAARISKGENYRRLPYVVLDYPRSFTGQDVFAIRTMFWWGNFFSITLQLSGTYKKRYHQLLADNFIRLKNNGFYVCVNNDPWQHHFGEDYYLPVSGFSQEGFEEAMMEKSFVKLAKKYSLNDWERIPLLCEADFRVIVEMLGN